MQHTFGLEIAEIGGEKLQGGYNGFREVVHGELLLGAARSEIFCHEADQSDSRDPCIERHNLEPIKVFPFFLRGKLFVEYICISGVID